jgi:hypothetical protein
VRAISHHLDCWATFFPPDIVFDIVEPLKQLMWVIMHASWLPRRRSIFFQLKLLVSPSCWAQ